MAKLRVTAFLAWRPAFVAEETLRTGAIETAIDMVTNAVGHINDTRGVPFFAVVACGKRRCLARLCR